MNGLCIMSDDKLVQELRGDIKDLTGGMSGLRESIITLTGKLDLFDEKLKHKAERNDITRDIQLHEMTCNTRKSDSKSGFWSGMTAGQKTAIVTLLVTNLGQLIPTIMNISR